MDNVQYIREQIERKNNYNIPYYATKNSITNVVTDQDHFPYSRHYRGVYHSSKPVIFEREAGYRERNDQCYIPQSGGAYKFLNKAEGIVFQQPANTVIPPKPEETEQEEDTNCNIGSKFL